MERPGDGLLNTISYRTGEICSHFKHHFWLVVDRHKLTVFYLKSFDMDSVQVGKAVFGKEIHTTLGIEPRTNSNPGRYGNPYSVCWFKKYQIFFSDSIILT